MVRNILSLAAAALFLTLASACATSSGTAASPQPEVKPTAAPAQQSTAAAPVQVASTGAAAKKEFHPDDMVCRIYEITGTRAMKQRICKTREQWIEDTRAAQEVMRIMQDNVTPPVPP
ncbi:MAG: hypothetical protein ACT4PK_05175 [Gammaproteobacteria bacterium]